MSTAYLFCPAYPLADSMAVTKAVASAQRFCTALDLTLVCSPLLDQHPGVGAWLPTEQRRDDLRTALGHDWLLPARGGYGCIDLLQDLVPAGRLCGYSDVTALHAGWATLGGPETLYGFLPGVPHGERAFTSAVTLTRGQELRVDGLEVLRSGDVEGPLFAGCLRVLTGLIGTPWFPDLTGKILAIEDIDERPYRIDRDLWQLHWAGALNGVVGLVAGLFPSVDPPGYVGPTADQVIAAWAERLGIPAIGRVPFGHDPDPLTLACGRNSRILGRHADGALIQHPR